MFTGLVEELGRVIAAEPDGDGYRLEIEAELTRQDARLGDSIAVDGVCLTIAILTPRGFVFGLAPETMRRTTLGVLRRGDFVALERAALPTTRLGGHYVQGHVDGVGEIRARRPDGDALWIEVAAAPALMRYIVSKGYVTVDGASLTVVNTGPDWFDLTLVAYSREKLALAGKPVGAGVNLEVDVLAKYVERLLSWRTRDREVPVTQKGVA